MTAIVRAELIRLARRRTLIAGGAGALAFAAVSALAVFASASPAPGPAAPRGGTTLATLAGTGGGTEAFAVGASRAGFLVFVTFIALVAGEFSSGTFRALVLREPQRLRLVAGKVAGALLVTAGVVAAAEALTFALSLAVAPTQEVATAAWFSLDGVVAALAHYATVMLGLAGWAVFGTTLAVVFRSVPVALGVGFAWAGPFENIIVDSWTAGLRVFPGQVLGALIQGGTAELGMGRALATAALYTGLAAVITSYLVSRKDVTA